ncbi:hypothetical protein B0H15DRAFT_854902 [Mycena belliarum]|uniref:Uncharacterized protein n=1 Tax=Mycena belliarum TaxID=1033014 RepID=A0AAD6TVS0_9AGAR|nr:hypothetical protein B0H15DRAFT_854902 [Mycena belliae]
MADILPDEILSEILSPALRVPDEAFADTSRGPSVFMNLSESSSAYLLVSKAWLRVATPLLYHVVVLRSKAQAQALAATLKSNPELGRFIKKLRVEGGYASSMYKILKMSTTVTDLFLSLNIVSDNACGLCRGLPLIDPCRVIVDGRHYGLTTSAHKLLETLETCLVNWKRLAVFDIPGVMDHRTAYSISKALAKAPNLNTLTISCHISSPPSVSGHIRLIATNPSLKYIRLNPPSTTLREDVVTAVNKDARLKELFHLPEQSSLLSEEKPTPPSEQLTLPLLDAGKIKEEAIWSRVLYYALQPVPKRTGNVWRTYRRAERPSILNIGPLLVSKMFMRLGIPHLYESPILETSLAAASFASRLAEDSSLRHYVRRLKISSCELPIFKSLVLHTPALAELHGGRKFSITWKAFSDLGSVTGSSLLTFQGVAIAKSSEAVSAAVFSQFSCIRSFCWSSTTAFKVARKSIPATTFNTLVHLGIKKNDSSFLTVLSHMELPSLRTTHFSATSTGGRLFFQRHGSKLQELTISVHQLTTSVLHDCPSLTVLGICCDDKTLLMLSELEPSCKHACLQRIIFKLPDVDMPKQTQRAPCSRFLLSLDSIRFPALVEIKHPHCDWPTTESQINKSHWVRWAETLLDHNIHLVGTSGIQWRRRLKYVPQKAPGTSKKAKGSQLEGTSR